MAHGTGRARVWEDVGRNTMIRHPMVALLENNLGQLEQIVAGED